MRNLLTLMLVAWLASAPLWCPAETVRWTVEDDGVKARVEFSTVPGRLERRLSKRLDLEGLSLAVLTVDNRSGEDTYVVDPDGVVQVKLKDGTRVTSTDLSWQLFWGGDRELLFLMSHDRVAPLSDRKWLVAFKTTFKPEDVESVTVTVFRPRREEEDTETPATPPAR